MFVHGRAQENKDPTALKAEWVTAFRGGLAKGGLTLPIPDGDIHFPYYGDTLSQLVAEPGAIPAEVIVRGVVDDRARREFLLSVLEETCARRGITDAQVAAEVDDDVRDRGVFNEQWALALLRAIDRHVPGASAAAIALATNDVYEYLRNPGVRGLIETGVRRTIRPGVETVVVSHSLGTIVAYNLLRRDGIGAGWKVPLHVTLGSPLAVTAVKRALFPIAHPACTDAWFNAIDPRDVVALYPLDAAHFDVKPPVTNKTDIDNPTSNRHGIGGYLGDPVVARRIHGVLIG